MSEAPASESKLHLFEAYGVELEYMIVGAETLDVKPIADEVLRDLADGSRPDGEDPDDVEFPDITWSNELMRHVIELKTSQPAPQLDLLSEQFQKHIARIEARLAPHGARLMPTGMHPWMNPDVEAELWPHGNREIYETYNRIFDCRGHGWSNVQSAHLNLPFRGDEEFARLHTAIRALLPLLPALAASSPYRDGVLADFCDARLEAYRTNQARVPSISGRIIPEPVQSRGEYEEQIFGPMWRDIAPFDIENLLRHEWLNSRGAIARFSRGAIEIRVLDTQECAAADLAIIALIVETLKRLCQSSGAQLARLRALDTESLRGVFLRATRGGDLAELDSQGTDAQLLDAIGIESPPKLNAGGVWRVLAGRAWPGGIPQTYREPLETIFEHGCLARRIVASANAGKNSGADALRRVYGELADCLRFGRVFRPAI